MSKLSDLIQEFCPDGVYAFSQKLKKANVVSKGFMEVKNEIMYLKSGSILAPESERRDENKHLYKDLKIENNILKEDVVMKSVSTAAAIVCGKSSNGWVCWKDSNKHLIDVYRKK